MRHIIHIYPPCQSVPNKIYRLLIEKQQTETHSMFETVLGNLQNLIDKQEEKEEEPEKALDFFDSPAQTFKSWGKKQHEECDKVNIVVVCILYIVFHILY